MTVKWLGFTVIIAGCGGLGFGMAGFYRQEIKNIRQLLTVVEYMICQLEYRAPPLPELCLQGAQLVSGAVKNLFLELNRELMRQISPDARCCMDAAIARTGELTPQAQKLARRLGQSLGYFDLSGQLLELQSVQKQCRDGLAQLCSRQQERIRSYQTLGLCAGAALAILLL